MLITTLLLTLALGCRSCRHHDVAGTQLPDPAADDRQDGSPAELPRVRVEMPPNSERAATTVLHDGDNLQSAIDHAQPGDVIALQAGAVFRGPITLPAKDGDQWITIRTDANGFWPAGKRIQPSPSLRMPVIEANNDSAMTADARAHHYRFIGIEIRPPANVFVGTLVSLGSDNPSFDDLPHHIVFERCYVHGDATVGGRRGIALNGRHMAVVDSYVADFKEKGHDAQAVAGWNGAGPFAILNDYLEASGENLMFGGADPDVQNLVPSDIEIRGNDFVKPVAWKSTGQWSVKNILELKNARRVLIDDNVFENNWADAQNGFAILFTVRNQDGGSPWSMVRDVTFTRNVVLHTASGVNILGTDDLHPSQRTKRITIRNNVFEDVNGPAWGGAGRLFQMLDGPADVVIDHNTGFQSGDILTGEGQPSARFVFTNNIALHNQFGVGGSNTFGNPPQALATYFPGAVFTKNVLIGGRAEKYPAGNYFPATVDAVGFADAANGDYRLKGDSQYRKSATDGADLGADLNAPPNTRRHAVGGH